MGLVDFVKDAGRRVGMFGGREAAEAEAARKEAEAAATAAQAGAGKSDLAWRMVAADIKAAILSYVDVADLVVAFDGTTATIGGVPRSQADREKAVLVAGNTRGVARVDDQLVVVAGAAPARYHTVVSGDTLGAIAARYYGMMRLYEAIFEANQPMLDHPDRIYPGQVLRIPDVSPPQHVVRRGDTLGGIASHWYGDSKSYRLIARENQLAEGDPLQEGRTLTIPLGNRPA